jgi:hypothetical protein
MLKAPASIAVAGKVRPSAQAHLRSLPGLTMVGGAPVG